MQKAPVLKGSGLAPIDDEPVHVFGRNLESRVVESRVVEDEEKKEDEGGKQIAVEDEDVETIKKRKFDAITGEEGEETVFQGDFKLFVWDIASSNWIEKGRGQLKLNDDLDGGRSRLIMRAGGTFRIILNVAIRHSLFKVISNTKTSIRFSDSQNVWAASGSNAKQLGDLLNDRITEAALDAAHGEEDEQRTKELKKEEETDDAVDRNDCAGVATDNNQKKESIQTPEKKPLDLSSSSDGSDKAAEEGTEQERQSDAIEEKVVVTAEGGDPNKDDQEETSEGDGEHADSETSPNKKDAATKEEPKPRGEPQTVDEPKEENGEHHKGGDETKEIKLSSE